MGETGVMRNKGIMDAVNITMRHEEKYICSERYLMLLEHKLRAIMEPDANQGDDGYNIRSLYFDTLEDDLFNEGLQGIEKRNKYRVRIYNCERQVIKLEKKTSNRYLKSKRTSRLLEEETQRLMLNEELVSNLEHCNDDELKQEFLTLQRTQLLQPKIIVDYNRMAFVSDIGNVRITLDRNICATDKVTGFFDKELLLYPILPRGVHLLEVKYDGILPGYLARLLNYENLERTSFSKYVLGMNMMKNNGRMSELYEF